MLVAAVPSILLVLLFLLLRHAPRPHRWESERVTLGVTLSTTGLNRFPRALLSRLTNSLPPGSVRRFYDAGAAVGVIGAVASCAGAIWAAAHAWGAVWVEAEAHARGHPGGNLAGPGPGGRVGSGGSPDAAHVARALVARAVEVVARASNERSTPPPLPHSTDPGLQPLIPGLTAPLSHLPTLLLALVVAQLLHELGHAMAAALDDVTPNKLALSLHAVLPSAAVVFPASVDYLPARARARLATAGAWHNLLLFATAFAAASISSTLWPEPLSEGRLIVGFSHNSPLAQQLHVGDMVTHLDETFVGAGDAWEHYLSEPQHPPPDLWGWCTSNQGFSDAPQAPCQAMSLTAFVPVVESASASRPIEKDIARCLAPYGLLSSPPAPCKCGLAELCVRLAPGERVLRLRYRTAGDKGHETLLWAGDRAAVLEQVYVARASGRGALATCIALFATYWQLVNLSLFLFNLLPLPGTDGVQLLAACLALPLRDRERRTPTQGSRHPTINPYRYDSDEDSEPDQSWGAVGRREEVWARRVRRAVEGVMGAVVIAWVLGWAMLALLRSS